MPLSGGLGTSAAAYVAGLLAADSIFELDADVLALATALEGHPDNVAAALHGGIVLCADGEATRFDPPAGLEAVLVVPHRHVRTAKARAALPAEVPMADAVFNVAHASLLVLGLAQGRLDLVARGLADRLHQPRRAALYPESMALLARAPEFGALGASISGAGPTVLVWSQYDATAGVVERLRAETDGLGRRAAGPVRAPGRGRAGAHLGLDEHRRAGRHAAHEPADVGGPGAHAAERGGLADGPQVRRRVDRQAVAAGPARRSASSGGRRARAGSSRRATPGRPGAACR